MPALIPRKFPKYDPSDERPCRTVTKEEFRQLVTGYWPDDAVRLFFSNDTFPKYYIGVGAECLLIRHDGEKK